MAPDAYGLQLDHLAVVGATLDEAVSLVEAALGVPLDPGGKHSRMGTHNRLLALGPGLYLEAIAIDPAARPPDHPRWFNLDHVAGAAHLGNWIVRCNNLAAALEAAPAGSGIPVAFARGRFEWTMAVPRDGRLPFDGCSPAIMQWRCDTHPSGLLSDRGCRLRCLHVRHPEADALLAAFPGLQDLELVEISAAESPALAAEFSTPGGVRWLD